ncbi:MAG: excinuclease ABC subunit UvrC, partial [Lentisphaeria bacterium]
MTTVRFHPQEFPADPGIYLFRNAAGDVIYVGKAKSLRKRLSSYFQPSRRRTPDPKLRTLIRIISAVETRVVRSEAEALLLESRLIKEYKPRYNSDLRDDKRFLCVAVDGRETFPHLALTRLKRPDGRDYFGPFPHSTVVRETVDFLTDWLGLRSCGGRRPSPARAGHCLNAEVRHCPAPCRGGITPEAYGERLAQAMAVLRGGAGVLPAQAELERRMREAAAGQRYEEAAHWRDLHELLHSWRRGLRAFDRGPQRLPDDPAMGGGAAVADLQRALGLHQPPQVIECVDISNLSGTLNVGSLTCFRGGRPSPRDYRRFRIRTVEGCDDFAAVRELVFRHAQRRLQEARPFPDLLVIDGGAGQLGAAIAGLQVAGAPPVAIVGLAKRHEEVYIPGRELPLALPRHQSALKLLQAIRDEAHRFALAYHHTLRNARIRESLLDDIEGVGPIRKLALLKQSGSLRRLAMATP